MGLTHAILVYYISLAVVGKDAIAIGATRSHGGEWGCDRMVGNGDAIAWWEMGMRSEDSAASLTRAEEWGCDTRLAHATRSLLA